ncbi:MAG TPA: hopanoid biosynthesis-associated protein HpnK [Stellaceae bacterium]
MKRLIVTADDFGLTTPVNEAVEDGHCRGILTAASLMVTGEAAADAVARAKRLPKLGVGLHLVLVDGAPVLAPAQIPDLVGSDGRFSANVFAQGVRIFCLPSVRRQLAAEIRAQLEAFRATGLTLDHVNAHHHFHLHPTIQQTLLRLAPEFGIRAVRLPLEPPGASGRRWAWLTGFMESRHARRLREKLDIAGVAHNDWIFGLADTGAMTAERLRHYLEALPDGASEIYFHPATARPSVWPANYRYADEAAALIDPEARAIIARRGIEIMPFAGLERAA